MTLKLGMIGLDTSHCEAFARILNDNRNPHHVSGCKVVRAFPGGSDATAFSRDRIASITEKMRDGLGIEIQDSIASMAKGMDGFLIESVDGRQHLEQFRELAEYGKPIFIDKPLACSREDAVAIARIAQKKKIPVMTASAIRFAKGIDDLLDSSTAVEGCDAFGPMSLPADYPAYYWYGIHTAEILFRFMGKGCRSVRAVHQENSDLIVGEWTDGRIGTLRGNRIEGCNSFGCTAFFKGGYRTGVAAGDPPYYAMLLRKTVPFLKTGKAPIDFEESVEIISFLDAATRSREKGGESVGVAG
jgi:hypothetical protein